MCLQYVACYCSMLHVIACYCSVTVIRKKADPAVMILWKPCGVTGLSLLSRLCVLLAGARGPDFYQATTPPPARGAGCSLGQHTFTFPLRVLCKKTVTVVWSPVTQGCKLPNKLSSLCFPAASLHVCAYISYFRRCVTSTPLLSLGNKTQERLLETKTQPLSFCPYPGCNLSIHPLRIHKTALSLIDVFVVLCFDWNPFRPYLLMKFGT